MALKKKKQQYRMRPKRHVEFTQTNNLTRAKQ